MKTIDEICDEYGFKYLDGNIRAIKAIQADAHLAGKIKGMEAAAGTIVSSYPKRIQGYEMECAFDLGVSAKRESILTAANSLKEGK